MEIIKKVNQLRKRVCEYRLAKHEQNEISTHVNSIDIVISLVELGLKDKRPISKEEENWFKAGLYLSYVFDGSEWEDIVRDFEIIVSEVENQNYFRKTSFPDE